MAATSTLTLICMLVVGVATESAGRLPKVFDLTNGVMPDIEDLDSCPTLSGQEELRQLGMFWMRYIGLQPTGRYTIEKLATLVSGLYVENPGLFSRPVPLTYEFDRSLEHTNEQITMRFVLTEKTANGQLTNGGSSFRAMTKGKTSKAMCPYRDYFNGTYLICCSVVEDMAELSIVHEYGNFSAFEAFVETSAQVSKRNDTVIWREVLTLPKHYSLTNNGPIMNDLKDSYGHETRCARVDYSDPSGHWMLIDGMWKWVVDGCRFFYMRTVDTQECMTKKFNKQLFVIGDYHMRNFFYYLVHEMDPEFKDFRKVHGDINVGDFHYKWSTSTYVLEDYLEDFLLNLQPKKTYADLPGGRRENFHYRITRPDPEVVDNEDMLEPMEDYIMEEQEGDQHHEEVGSNEEEPVHLSEQERYTMEQILNGGNVSLASLTDEKPKQHANVMLVIDLGIWSLMSRPIADYILALDNIVAKVKPLVEENVVVIYQDIPASPQVPYINKPNPSNQLYGALNFLACSKLQAVGAHCSTHWRYTMPWIEELLCASNTHTMCYDQVTERLEVMPPGHVTSQYIMRTACGLWQSSPDGL